MNVLEFLQHGNVTPNPDYNPKTKKGKYQAPTLVDYKPGTSTSDKGRSDITRIAASNLYSFNTKDVNKFAEYDVYMNPYDTIEELNRERADNQGAIEQTGRMLGQALVNEVVIGTVLGFSNLADLAINGVQWAIDKANGEEHINDYTNPLSKTLEDTQNSIREAWEIYRRNPNDTWDMSDYGWWASNMVSVASTASMLLPTLGVTKGLSMVGKGIRAASAAGKGGRVIKGLNELGKKFNAENIAIGLSNKYSNKFSGLKDTGRLADQLKFGREITQNAVLSRTMENYLEARETWNSVRPEAYSRLQAMNAEQKDEFFKNNPNFVGKTDEEIADYIASESAHETFMNDYAMLLMDVVQFKGLADIYKGARKGSNASLALATKKQKDAFLNKVLPESTKLKDKIANSDWFFKAKYMAQHPMDGMFAIEWSEGIEEGYQGIQAEKGKEVAEKMFDPNFTPRDIESYLADPAIWEQAFWGVVGAVGFAGAGKGLRYLKNKIEKGIEEYSMDEKEIELSRLSDQMQRKKGIEGWAANAKAYIETTNIINEGFNPYKPVLDKKGEQVKDENGKPVYEALDPQSQELYRKRALNIYLTEAVLNAADRGNLDIFEAFITDPEITKAIREQTKNEANNDRFNAEIVSRVKDISNKYTRNLFNIRNSIHVSNPYIGNIMARAITRRQLDIQDGNNEINRIDAQIEDLLGDDLHAYDNFEQDAIVKFVEKQLTQLSKQEEYFNKQLSNKEISYDAHRDYIRDINKHRNDLYSYLSDVIPDINNFEDYKQLISAINPDLTHDQISKLSSDLSAKFNAFKSQFQLPITAPTKAVANLLGRRARLKYDIKSIESQIPTTTKGFQAAYDEHSITLDRMVASRFKNATDAVINWIEKQEDLNDAKNKLYTNAVPELEDALKMLKLGHVSTQQYWSYINLALASEQAQRKKNEEANQRVTVNGEEQTPEKAEELRAELEENEKEDDDFSTGQGEESKPTIPAMPSEVAENTTKNNNDEKLPEVPPAIPVSPPKEEPTYIAEDEFEPSIDDEYNGEPEYDEMETYIPDSEILDEDAFIDSDEEVMDYLNNPYETFKHIAIDVVKDMIKENPNNFRNIKLDERNNTTYQNLITNIANKIINEIGTGSINITEAKTLAEYGIAINEFIIKNKVKNLDIVDLAKAIISDCKATNLFSANPVISDFLDSNDGGKRDADRFELVKAFLEAYAKERKLRKVKSKYTININNLFDYMLNDRGDISTEQGIQLFRNLYGFIVRNQDILDYRFRNIKLLKDAYKDPTYIKDTLRGIKDAIKAKSRYQHVVMSNKEGAKEALQRHKHGDPVTVVYDPLENDGNIAFFIEGTEVGFLAPVTKSEDNNTFSSLATNGFKWEVTKNADGTYTMGAFDELFEALLLNGDKYQDLYDAIFSEDIDINDAVAILNNEIIKNLIKSSKIKYNNIINILNAANNEKLIDAYAEDILKVASKIKNTIINITTFDANAEEDIQKFMSYTAFVKKTYDNYEMTHNLMYAKQATVTFRNIWEGPVNYSTTEEFDCNTRGFNAKDNPMLGIMDKATIRVEGKDHDYPNTVGFPKGTMGFMVRDSDTGIAIAKITGFKPVSSNSHITELLDKEITELFTKYNNDVNYSFDKFKSDIIALFGTAQTAGNSLFRGLTVVANQDYFGIRTIGSKESPGKFIFTVSRYKKGTKKENRNIYFKKGKDDKSNVAINAKYFNTLIKNALDVIHDNLKFNGTYFTIKNVNKADVNNTKYMYINNERKLVINLGGETLTYDSFTDFALKENICKTNQLVDENGNYFNNEWATKSLFIDTETVHINSPVEGTLNDANTKYNSLEDIKQEGAKTPIPTKTVLDLAGVPKEMQDFFSVVEKEGIPLLPANVHYDKQYNENSNVNAIYKRTTGKVYITNAFIKKFKDNPKNITPIIHIIHEQIHAQFATLSESKRKRILNDLIELQEDIIKALNKDRNSSDLEKRKLANAIYDWITNGMMSVEQYAERLPTTARTKFLAKTKEEQTQQWIEEWLVESMTQADLMKYLNDTEYKNDKVEINGEKSLFQRLLDILRQFFNTFGTYAGKFDKIKDNSILAAQFNILSDNYVKKENTTESVENIEEQQVSKSDEQIVDDTVDNKTDNAENDNTINDDTINPEDEIATPIPEAPVDNNIFSEDDLNSMDFDMDEDTDEDFSAIPLINDNVLDETNNTVDDIILKYLENPEINPFGVVPIDNINDFLSKFEEKDREMISKALDNGTIKWVCF